MNQNNMLLCMFSACVIVTVASIDPTDFAPLATAGDEQQLKTMPFIAYCKDQNSQCSEWAKRGECTLDPIWMNLNCQDSCKVCHDGDKDFYCGYWARRGECTKNPKYMNITCASSCLRYASSKRSSDNRVENSSPNVINRKPEQRNYVKDPSDFEPLETETANDEQPWKYPSSVDVIIYCKDQNSKCAEWAKQGLCSQNPIYMIANCQDSCKICHDGDKDLQCGYRARYRGQCTTNADWMINHCVASCFRYGKCIKSGDDRVEELFNDVINRKPERRSYSIDPLDFTLLAVATADDEQPCRRLETRRFSAICKDQHSKCLAWAKGVECEINPIYMNLGCQDSCKVCHGGDKNIYCGYFARRGDCSNYLDWMFKNCAGSCSIYTFGMATKNFDKYYVGRSNGNEAWIIKDSSYNPVKKFQEVPGLVYQNPVNTTAKGKIVSFKWENVYLRHSSKKLYFHQPPVNDVAALQLFNKDASFIITEDGGYFRLESENLPGYFMRHRDFRLWLEKGTEDKLFKYDSTFKKIPLM